VIHSPPAEDDLLDQEGSSNQQSDSTFQHPQSPSPQVQSSPKTQSVPGLTLQVPEYPRMPPACPLQSPACSSLETPPRVTLKATVAPKPVGRTQKRTYTCTKGSEPASSSSEPPICCSACTGAGQAMDPRELHNATAYLQLLVPIKSIFWLQVLSQSSPLHLKTPCSPPQSRRELRTMKISFWVQTSSLKPALALMKAALMI
jgi:hypothetical protein